ncbi:pentapeptide repeat-containing protein [Glaesserella sp.]|uniref:pentapeptide repeat-containing protein n=1 Tax=Glaesserella sp. TaxID=2094731 RepID=UPI0035A00851
MKKQYIEKMLYEINQNLIKDDSFDLFETIKKYKVVKNKDFHRYEIIHKNIQGINFVESSFRGVFIESSEFSNCNFERCSFVAANIVNSKFSNCKFKDCIFLSHFVDENLEDNCLFLNCYNESVFIDCSTKILSLK